MSDSPQPDDAYGILGLDPALRIDREQLNEAYRRASRELHPDAGGDERQFAALQEAVNTLQSPARRLRHWLELRGLEVEGRGPVGPEIMGWFGKVGEVTQQAEGLIRRREAARSALARALLEGETHQCREVVGATISGVEQAIQEACAGFGPMEDGPVDPGSASQLHRELRFLEKWRATLRALYGRLV